MKIFKKMKKGSGDAVSFTVLAPIMVMLISMTVYLVLYMSLREKLEYTTYVACRAAVVSDTLADARRNANIVAKEDMKSYAPLIDGNTATITLNYTSGAKNVKSKKADGTTRSSKWGKGNFLECKVSVKPTIPVLGLNSKKVECNIVMAIEKLEDYG